MTSFLRIFLFVLLIVRINSQANNKDIDEYITIENEQDDDNVITTDIIKHLKSARFDWFYPEVDSQEKTKEDGRKGRILWPEPLNITGKANDSENANKSKAEESKRQKRLLYYSYPQNPIVDIMMQSGSTHYSQYTSQNQNDPFEILRDSYPLPKGADKPFDEYDYIIVGAGAAGSVLASRLSEDKPRATVLVLEAGRPEMLLTDIPIMAPYFSLTDYAWPYQMEHQPGVCLGSEKQRCYWPRGKAVGGTSVINFMLYTRGRPQEWDRIAADGNYGWSYNEVLHYYMKSERAELKKYKNATYRGRDGELTIENPPFRTRLVEAFLAAGRQFGHPTVDYNAPEQLGFGYAQTTTKLGHRLSSAKAFLHPHKRRKNLHILTEAIATKVLIEPQSKRAYAVEFTQNGKKYTIRARREIILSAGPIASPQLLMLSGVGPKDHLQSLGIPVISDLAVGRTLYDHIAFPGVIFRLNSTNSSLLESKIVTVQNLMQWLQFGDGLLASPGTIEALGYIKTPQSDQPPEIPDIELISMGGSITSDSGHITRKAWKITDVAYDTGYSQLNNLDTWSAVPMLLHPKSRGYLELRDTNPFSHPKLHGNYLTDSQDMNTLKEAVKYVIKLGESEPFRKFGAQLHYAKFPMCNNQELGSDNYWDCAIRTMLITLHHQIATCKMGPPTDPEAIVDPELRVYGVYGLRVVDSSIIPRTTSAHTNAPAIMIGEKAADMIKQTWAHLNA